MRKNFQYKTNTRPSMSFKSKQDFKSTYESDIKYSINGARLLAILIGVWPINSQEFPLKAIVKQIINFSSSTLMTFVIASNILCLKQMETMDERIENLGPISFYTGTILKYFLLVYHGKSLGKCFRVLKEDWQLIDTQEKRELMLKNAKFARFVSILSALFMIGGGLGHHVLKPLISECIVTEMNITVQPFPSPVYGKFFNTGYSPVYEIVFCVVVTADLFLISAAAVSFNLPAILILHACGQFEIVILYLDDLVCGLKENKNSAHERFVSIVDSHLRVLSFVSELEKLFNGLFLVEMMCSSINVCLLGYYVVQSLKDGDCALSINFGILLMGFIFEIFAYCYIAETLTIQAGKVGETGYMIDWHQLPKSISQDLLFFIRICQFPLKISAGKIVYLSMTTFTNVMKSSMAYFNVIWNMS